MQILVFLKLHKHLDKHLLLQQLRVRLTWLRGSNETFSAKSNTDCVVTVITKEGSAIGGSSNTPEIKVILLTLMQVQLLQNICGKR